MPLPMAVTGEQEFKEGKSMNTKRLKELRSYKGTQKRMILCSCAHTGQMSKVTGALEKKDYLCYAISAIPGTAGDLLCVDLDYYVAVTRIG